MPPSFAAYFARPFLLINILGRHGAREGGRTSSEFTPEWSVSPFGSAQRGRLRGVAGSVRSKIPGPIVAVDPQETAVTRGSLRSTGSGNDGICPCSGGSGRGRQNRGLAEVGAAARAAASRSDDAGGHSCHHQGMSERIVRFDDTGTLTPISSEVGS
jgi:hypothetical protein